MGFDMFPHVTANPGQKCLDLLFPMSGEARLRRPALLMSGVHQACPSLTVYELCAPADANAVRPQAHQNQSDEKVTSKKMTQWLNVVAVGHIFFCNRKRGQDHVHSRRATEKRRSHC